MPDRFASGEGLDGRDDSTQNSLSRAERVVDDRGISKDDGSGYEIFVVESPSKYSTW
jgi:hypothetical protein